MADIDNLLGSTRRVVEEQEPLNNCRGVTYRVINVDGGGGSSVDYTKVVSKTDSMPVASADNADIIYLYDGETDATYTHGYIYENVATTTSSSASAAQTVGSGLSDIAVDLETLESFTGWTTDNSLQIFYTEDGWSVDATSLGVTYTGTPSVGDAITITYTAAVTTYAWVRQDVQPQPEKELPTQAGNSGKYLKTNGVSASWADVESLPSQSGQSGKFLTTDGTNASWGTVGGLPDQTGQSGKFLTTNGTSASWSDKPLANGATGSFSLAVGNTSAPGSSCVAIGQFASTSGGSNEATSIGTNSTAGGNAVAIGASAKSYAYGVIIGSGATGFVSPTNNNSCYIAIGKEAKVTVDHAIQIGKGTNSDTNTVKIANANGNFEIMNAAGNIPADRIASTTGLADGNYRLRLTMASGVPTLSWVAE